MGSKSGPTTTTGGTTLANSSSSGTSSGVSSNTPDPLAGLAYQQVLQNAANIANTPYQPYQGQQVAGFTPDMIAGFQNIRNTQGVQNPYINQAANLYQQSTNTWQNPMMNQAQNYYGQSLGYVNNPFMNQTQDYLTAAMYSTANPQMNFAKDYTGQAVNAAQNQQLQNARNYFGQATTAAQNPEMAAARNYFSQAMGYTANPEMQQAQEYSSQAINEALNPELAATRRTFDQALGLASNLQLPTTQDYYQRSFGAAINPLLPQAQTYTGESVDLSDLGNFNQQALSQYMNPYQQSVTDATLAQMKQNQDVLQNQNVASAIRQGAYGGSGQFMGQAELGRQQALANAQTLAQLNAQNYAQAQAQYNQQQQQAVQARQQAAQLLNQMGYQQAGLSVNALQQAAQTLGQLGQQQAGLQAGTVAQQAQTMGQLGQQQAAARSAAAQQAAQLLGQLGQQQAALQAGTAVQAGQAQGQLGQAQANAISQALQQAGQTMGALGQQQAQTLSNAYQQGAQTMGQLGQQQAALGSQTATNAAQLMGQLGSQQAERGIQAYQNAAQNLGQLGQQQSTLGVNALQNAAAGAAGLGKQAQAANIADATALMQAGEMQRSLQQAQLDKAYEKWQQAKAYPYQQTSYFGGLAQGLGPLLGQYGTQAGSSLSSTSGIDYGNKTSQTSGGGGGIAGAITSGLGILSALKDGGVVKNRAHRDMGGYMSNVGELPYGKGPIDLSVGFGSLMKKTPFSDAPGNYIAEAEKAGDVIKPARQLAAEKLQSEINKVLGVIPKSKKSSGLDLSEESSSSDEPSWEDVAKKTTGLINKFNTDSGTSEGSTGGLDFSSAANSLSDLGSTISGFFSADGGRVGRADGGSFADQYAQSRTAQQQAQQVTGDYQKYLGRNADQQGFNNWTQQAAQGESPAQIAASFANSPERMRQVQENYVDILGRTPDSSGLQYWQNRAKQGMSFGDMQNAFRDSAAYANAPTAGAQNTVSTGWEALDPSGGVNKALARERMIDPSARPMSNYDMLLQQARQLNPGPQLTPEQQGMPSMPGPRYYTGEEGFGNLEPFVSAGADKNIAGAMKLPEKATVNPPPSIYASADAVHNFALSNIQGEQVALAYAFTYAGVNPAIATVMAVQSTQGKVDQVNREWEAARAAIDENLKNNPPPPKSAAEQLGLTNNYQDFVNSAYQNYLGRAPSESELQSSLREIASGKNPAEIERALRASPEVGQIDAIQKMYFDLLGRKGDQEGIRHWKSELDKGISLGDLEKEFKKSNEYTSVPEIFRSRAPVEGYFSEIADTQFNPYTGLFNLKYTAPYRGSAPSYDLGSALTPRNDLLDLVTKKLTASLPKADGGRIGKATGGGLSGKSLYDYLINIGANPKEAAMLTGNAKVESSFNPYVMHDNNTGYGLWGHGKDRWADMQKYTGQRKPGWEEQAKFALWELRNSPKAALARQTLAKANNAQDVAIAGMHYERPQGYNPSTPWAGKNWQQRFANVSNLMSGKDIGSGMIGRVDSDPGSDASSFVRSQGIGVPSATHRRPNLLARLVNALSPIGTAHAETAAPMTALPDWKQEVKTGFGPLQGEKPADAQQLLATPTQHANMGPEMPSDNVVASDKKDGQKYWGDYRDVEGSSFGDLIDALAGDVKTSDKPGTRETPMGKYQGQGGLGGLFDFEGTNPYAPQKKTKEEESFDLGHLFDIFG